MEITITIFLILYLLLTTFFILFSVSLIYHAVRFGVYNSTNLVTIGLYLAVAAGMLISSYVYISGVDWDLALKLF